MKNSAVQILRLAVQIIFFVGLMTGLIGGFMFVWPAILVGAFLLAAIAGNFYCGWLCPLGSLQEWFGKLGSVFVKRKLRMPQKTQRYLKYSKYVLYALLLANGALGILDGFFQTGVLDSNSVLYAVAGAGSFEGILNAASASALAFLAGYLALALFFDRPFCNYACPDGVKYSLLSFMRVFTIRRDTNKCIKCKKCSRACPMQINVAACGNLRNAGCINCMKCVAACPIEHALTYGLVRTQKSASGSRLPVQNNLPHAASVRREGVG